LLSFHAQNHSPPHPSAEIADGGRTELTKNSLSRQVQFVSSRNRAAPKFTLAPAEDYNPGSKREDHRTRLYTDETVTRVEIMDAANFNPRSSPELDAFFTINRGRTVIAEARWATVWKVGPFWPRVCICLRRGGAGTKAGFARVAKG
jgi:hypothetical protein